MNEGRDSSWQAIASAPADTEILVFTKPWGAIIASYSAEFGEWLSRMQVPVSIKDEEELPTHWQPLPTPPPDGAGPEAPRAEAALPGGR